MIEEGISIFTNEEQSWNAHLPIVTILDGISMLVNDEHLLKAPLPIESIKEGIVTSFNVSQ